MKIFSREKWADGTLVPWAVQVHEVLMDEQTLSEWYDRDAKSNAEVIKEGGLLRVFVVDRVLVSPDEERASEEVEPIAAGEFLGVGEGDKLVVFMNHREYAKKLYGEVSEDFSPWPTLINIQDCGFDVDVSEYPWPK